MQTPLTHSCFSRTFEVIRIGHGDGIGGKELCFQCRNVGFDVRHLHKVHHRPSVAIYPSADSEVVMHPANFPGHGRHKGEADREVNPVLRPSDRNRVVWKTGPNGPEPCNAETALAEAWPKSPKD